MLFVSLPFLVNLSGKPLPWWSRSWTGGDDRRSQSLAGVLAYHPAAGLARGSGGERLMMWARGISEFRGSGDPGLQPKIVPVLIYERFEGYGLTAAQPLTLLRSCGRWWCSSSAVGLCRKGLRAGKGL